MRFIPFVGGVYRATPPTAGIQGGVVEWEIERKVKTGG